MKIVQYISRIQLLEGGVARAVLDQCEVLAGRGHEVMLLCHDPEDVPDTWREPVADQPLLIPLEPAGRVLQRLNANALKTAAAKIHQADIVHLHVPWDPACIQLGRLCEKSDTPYVLSLHGMLDAWCMRQRGIKKRLFLAVGGRRLLERAAAVHCTAELEKEQSQQWYSHGRTVVIPLIIDLTAYERLPGVEHAQSAVALARDETPLILSLGRLDPIKRLELLIEAASQLHTQNIAFRLVIAGAGDSSYEKRLKDQIDAAGLDDQVLFVGFVSGINKASLFQLADIFVSPSRHENFGFSLFESLACATPVVTTSSVNTWKELNQSGGAVIVDADARSLTDCLKHMLTDEQTRRTMGRSAREWIFRNFAPDRTVSAYEELYRSLAKQSSQ